MPPKIWNNIDSIIAAHQNTPEPFPIYNNKPSVFHVCHLPYLPSMSLYREAADTVQDVRLAQADSLEYPFPPVVALEFIHCRIM